MNAKPFVLSLKIPHPVRRALKSTTFWKDNGVIFREFKYFHRVVILALIFTLLSAVFEAFGVGGLFAFLQSLTEPNAKPVQIGPAWFSALILGSSASTTERLYRICLLILVITLLRAVFSYLSALYSNIMTFKLAYQLRLRIFEQLQALSLSYFAKTRSGELINSITNEITLIMDAVTTMTLMMIRGATLLAYLVSMLVLSWQLTILSILLFSLLTAGISTLLGHVREASFRRSTASGRYTSTIVEFINGIRTVQAFAAQDFERKRFYDANKQFLKASVEALSIRSLVEPLAEGVSTTIVVILLILAFATLIPTGQLQVASLLTFLFIWFRMLPIVKQMNGYIAKMSNYRGSIDNLKEVLRTENKPYLRDGTQEFTGLNQAIEFHSVSFGYDYKHSVLNNITLTFEKGKTTALVGASGAGKSTLVDLVPRLYDPTQGQILVDKVSLQAFDVNSLRRRIAVVSQDTFIFNDTIRNNIAYALENVDESDILEAAKLANALEFIQELPQGLDTLLGDRGVRLSGGQRQRIAIARALLRNPEILILDEATSALDSVSERLIQESIEKLSKGRTVIAIAHRLSTIVRADKVIVLEQGEIVEQGSYQELLERRGKLWKYHQMQHQAS